MYCCYCPLVGCKEAKTVSTFKCPHHLVISLSVALLRWSAVVVVFFLTLMERLFSTHKMKWISAPEPEIGCGRQQFCCNLCLSLSFFHFLFFFLLCSLSLSLSLDFWVTDRCNCVPNFSAEYVASLLGFIRTTRKQTLSSSLSRIAII